MIRVGFVPERSTPAQMVLTQKEVLTPKGSYPKKGLYLAVVECRVDLSFNARAMPEF